MERGRIHTGTETDALFSGPGGDCFSTYKCPFETDKNCTAENTDCDSDVYSHTDCSGVPYAPILTLPALLQQEVWLLLLGGGGITPDELRCERSKWFLRFKIIMMIIIKIILLLTY